MLSITSEATGALHQVRPTICMFVGGWVVRGENVRTTLHPECVVTWS